MSAVEKVREALAGADKARKQAARYTELHEVTRGFGFEKKATLSPKRFTAWSNFMGSIRTAELNLDAAQIDIMSNYFAECAAAELRRAEAYENAALRAAGKEEETPLPRWRPEHINPNRINASLSDVMEDPALQVEREVTKG